jgi:hypothetical protein
MRHRYLPLLCLLLFAAGCATTKEETAVPQINEPLRAELLGMREADQTARNTITNRNDPAAMLRLRHIDTAHSIRMRQILDQHGWPGFSLVGRDGSDAAGVLVQHSDYELMKRALGMLERAVKRGDASPETQAYLTDRVRMRQGKMQLYGTQFQLSPGGELVVYPIKDADEVDERRRKMGLAPLAAYQQELRQRYGQKTAPAK